MDIPNGDIGKRIRSMHFLASGLMVLKPFCVILTAIHITLDKKELGSYKWRKCTFRNYKQHCSKQFLSVLIRLYRQAG